MQGVLSRGSRELHPHVFTSLHELRSSSLQVGTMCPVTCFSYDVSSSLTTHLSSCLETTLDIYTEEGLLFIVKLAALVSEARHVSSV